MTSSLRDDGPVVERTCPNQHNHTPLPVGYSHWTAHTITTHRQTRCPDCGRWVIWMPKTEDRP